MKQIYILLMTIGLLMIVSCQNDQTDEQIQVKTAVSIEQPASIVAEEVVAELPAETASESEANMEPLITPTNDSTNLLVETGFPILSLLTESDQLAQQFALTEYEFVNASVDDWADNDLDTGQPWLALARVVQAPYRIGHFDPYAPLWVLLGPEDVVEEVTAWQESVGDEMIGTASVFRTVPLPADTTLSDLLLTRNEWYLPELEGVLWIDRVLFKTDAENWTMNVVSPEVRPVLTNLPYSFSCDATTLQCVWINHFIKEANASKEYSIFIAQFEDQGLPGGDTEVFYLDNGRLLRCNPETAVCLNKLYPAMICDLDNGICTYQPSIDKQPQIYNLVNNDVDWSDEVRPEYIYANTLTNHGSPSRFSSNLVQCNWEQGECYYREDPFDCQFNDEKQICFLQPITQWPERIEAQIVPPSRSQNWLESDTTIHEIFSNMQSVKFKCNWQLRECIQENIQFTECDPVTSTCRFPDINMGSDLIFTMQPERPDNVTAEIRTADPYDYIIFACDWDKRVCGDNIEYHQFSCDKKTAICTAVSLYTNWTTEFSFVSTEPEWLDEADSIIRFPKQEFRENLICHRFYQECWDWNSPESYQLIECYATGEEAVICDFEHKYTGARYTFPLISSRPEYSLEGNNARLDFQIECSFEEETCYTIYAYEVDCHALTEQCTISNTYTNQTMLFDFVTEMGAIGHKPNDMGITIMNYDFYPVLAEGSASPSIYCDLSQRVCQVFPNLGGGGAWETRRCDLLSCPDDYLCSTARYNQYQCYLYNTPRPQR